MADPVTAGLTAIPGLLKAITTLFAEVRKFVSQALGAPEVTRAIRRELNALREILTAIQGSLEAPNVPARPPQLTEGLPVVIRYCRATIRDLKNILHQTRTRFWGALTWAYSGKDRAMSLLADLERWKLSLSIYLSVFQIDALDNVQQDIHNIQQDLRNVLTDIHRMEGRLMGNDDDGRIARLQRYLADAAAYIESVSGDSDSSNGDLPHRGGSPDVQDALVFNGVENREREDNAPARGNDIIREVPDPIEGPPPPPPQPPFMNREQQPENLDIRDAWHPNQRLPPPAPFVNQLRQPANPIIRDALHHNQRTPQRPIFIHHPRRQENSNMSQRLPERPVIFQLGSSRQNTPRNQPIYLGRMRGLLGSGAAVPLPAIGTHSSSRMRIYERHRQILRSSYSSHETTVVLDGNRRAVTETRRCVESVSVIQSVGDRMIEL